MRLNHRDTESTEKKKSEQTRVREVGSELSIFFFSSLCSLCLCGSALSSVLNVSFSEKRIIAMPRTAWPWALFVGLMFFGTTPLGAQIRVTPKESKGGEKQGEAWAEVPETFKNLKIPDWPVPTDLK